MNNTLHKGPFPLEIIKSDDKFIVITSQGTHYATTHDPAAARLISAAPDLLSALEELCADKYLSDPINADRMKNARTAIAKAKGAA